MGHGTPTARGSHLRNLCPHRRERSSFINKNSL